MKQQTKTWLKQTAIAGFVATTLASMAHGETIFQHSSTKSFGAMNITPQLAEGTFKLENGSITFRVRNVAQTPARGSNGSVQLAFGTLMGATSSLADRNYLWFYSRLDSNNNEQIGLEIRNAQGNLVPNAELLTTATPRNLGEYRTITYTFDKDAGQIKIYIDGQLQKTSNSSKFFNDVSGIDTIALGRAIRSQENPLAGDILYADITKNVLNADEIQTKHNQLVEAQNAAFKRHSLFGAEKTEKYEIFKPGQNGAKSYRIPSLFTTQKGTVIASIDKRHQHAGDWGNIDTVIRRSTDGGKTWGEDQVILDLASQSYGTENSAFLIDPLVVQDKNTGRIFMLIDMFPEMRGLFGFGAGAEPDGSGYKNIGGTQYRVLNDRYGNQYTVRENGVVYDENHQPTDYRVVVEGNREIAYKDLGDLYQGDTRLGNIFLNSQNPGNDSAPLMTKKTSYLWLIHSDDEGETWSNPVDITPQVKADWMQFMGVGPGNGIQLKNGNLVMPVYYTNNVGKLNGSQTAAVIISRDGGKTWERGEAPTDRWETANGGSRLLNNYYKQTTESQLIELDNGEIKMFSRNLIDGKKKVVISTSKDGGYSWTNSKVLDDALLDPYSQMSVIKYSKRINGKEIVIFANPHSTTRSNGKVWLGEVQDDGSIVWKYNTNITVGTPYAYNSLTELPNGDIGLLYEEFQGQNVQYVRLNIQELVWHDNFVHRDIRNPDNKEVDLNDSADQTFYKIGDGEIIQVGSGINAANLVVEEGLATLNQKANNQNQKQAFGNVKVNQNGTVRLGSVDQVNLSNLTLNQGTLDLNGNKIVIDDKSQPATGLRAATINGNIINQNSEEEADLTIALNGNRQINGTLGDENGKLNIAYKPTEKEANLVLAGNSVLNVIDVNKGTITYAPDTTHQVEKVNLTEANLVVTDGNKLNIKNTELDKLSNLVVHNTDKGVQITTDMSGEGNFIKSGAGALKLIGSLSHTGLTELKEGNIDLQGIIKGSTVVLGNRAVLSGNGKIDTHSIWAKGAMIEPAAQQPIAEGGRGFRNANSFSPQTLTFGSVSSLGADLVLRINNIFQNMQRWDHDRVIIEGDLTTTEPNHVEAKLLGTEKGVSDKNQNGQYDADEGLSLVQVKGNGELGQFVLNKTTASGADVSDIYKFTLVSVDKKVNGNDYYDYRLQNLLIDQDGNSPEAVIRYVEPTSPPSNNSNNDSGTDSSNSNNNGNTNTAGNVGNTTTDENTGNSGNTNNADNTNNISNTNTANNNGNSGNTNSAGNTNNISTNTANNNGNGDSTNSTGNTNNSNTTGNTLSNNTTPSYRAAINSRIPSYLVAPVAMYNHGNQISQQFIANLWKHDKQGFYVNQQNGNSRYTSNLAFTDYGYNFKSKQSSTLFGGYIPVGANSELHLGIGFGKYSVDPQVADGWSETRYKSTSFMAALHNQWNNLIVNASIGYHLQKGKINTLDAQNIATVKGRQFQVSGEIGYQIPFGNVVVTPVWGLTYQRVKTLTNNRVGNWKVDIDPFKVFTQHLGANLSWKGERIRLNAGAFYEHQNSHGGKAVIYANQAEQFKSGSLGSELVFKLNGDIALTEQLFLELGVAHRKALDKAKISQTHFGAKLEYRF
ncbi:MAG: exo-alpha-sialidase [Mannheimia varigena]|nr:exo-alpha-sialidase [Mannheimia varigena]